jgi:hypothetical protein
MLPIISTLLSLFITFHAHAFGGATIYIHHGMEEVSSDAFLRAHRSMVEKGEVFPSPDQAPYGVAVWSFYYSFTFNVDELNTNACYVGPIEGALQIVKLVTGEDNQGLYVKDVRAHDGRIALSLYDRTRSSDSSPWVEVRIPSCVYKMM